MSSAEDRGEPYYQGKRCYECYNCGTLVEYKWEDEDECPCGMEDEE
jgi:hypothetical protein